MQFKFDFSLFENFDELCFVVKGNGEISACNDAAKNLFPGKELEGLNFFSLLDAAYKGKVQLMLTNALEDNRTLRTYSIVEADSEIREFDLAVHPVSTNSEEEKSSYAFIFARDVTEERKKEVDLLRFYYVAENTVNPLQITDLQGKMVYVNSAFVNASGFSKNELIGKNPQIFGSGKHSKKFWAKMWSTINKGKVWVGEVENRRKNGEPFYTQLLISPILDNEGNVTAFFGIHRDLTEKRIMEKQLIHTQKMESMGTLAAGVAHEVGNPLASISALVQVIQRTTGDEFVKEKLELVKSQVTRISKIIRDLVDFSRPSNYELQLTDINQNIVEAVEITKVGTKAKDITFEVDLNENIPSLPLIADQIQQIFVNIMLNAVDAIAEIDIDHGGKRISVKSDVDDDNVIITFSDTGKGIPEENLVKVFEPFFTTKKEGKGTGLGLWVSYGIVKSFQGDIKVASKLNEGTTFKITLPINP